MKKLTKKEIDLTLDLIEVAISRIGKYELNDKEYSVYEKLGKCKYEVKCLSNYIRKGYDDDFGRTTYNEILAIRYKDLLNEIGRR